MSKRFTGTFFSLTQFGPSGERESPPKGNDSGLSDETGGGKSDVSRLRVIIGKSWPVTQISAAC